MPPKMKLAVSKSPEGAGPLDLSRSARGKMSSRPSQRRGIAPQRHAPSGVATKKLLSVKESEDSPRAQTAAELQRLNDDIQRRLEDMQARHEKEKAELHEALRSQRYSQRGTQSRRRLLLPPASSSDPERHSESGTCVKVTGSGVFLVLDLEGSAPSKWEALAKEWQGYAKRNMLPGVDLRECAVLPMRADPRWGEDMGPHFSIVSLPGNVTEDLEGTPDPYEEVPVEGSAGRKRRVLSKELRERAAQIEGERHVLDLSNPRVSFLLGAESNDEVTNGPVMVTASHDTVRSVLDSIRESIGLKPFALEHSVHTTLCKVTDRSCDHKMFRARLTDWPKDGAYPKELRSLADAFRPHEHAQIAPELAPSARIPDSCTPGVVNAALRVASHVATEGVGEKQEGTPKITSRRRPSDASRP